MNLKEAVELRDLHSRYDCDCAPCEPDYSCYEARGFIEGLNSPEVYQREDIKRLVSAVVQLKLAIESGCAEIKETTKEPAMIDIADWFLESIDLAGFDEAISQIPKESEVKE